MTTDSESPEKPRVGITLGDPAGIGPEIVLKSVAERCLLEACRPVIIGSALQLHRQAELLGLPHGFQSYPENDIGLLTGEAPVIVDTGPGDHDIRWGALSSHAGQQAVAAVETAVRLCLSGSLDAVATAPLNKEALQMSGSPYPGHTELLASLCNAPTPLMCFFAEHLKVFLLTVHLSLAKAIAAISKEKVVESVRIADRELRRFGIARPRIAVAGLNPHAGEHGLFGTEDQDEIEPAIIECRTRHGIDVNGPYPADTIFLRAWRREFDAVAACYHDQGLIAVKCLAFGKAVNVTLGLPIIRTSVDHGTAFDIAGRGVADPQSMVEAILLGAKLVAQQKSHSKSKEILST
ncbi:MAG TPA: 4-hydroxythreonine-4-phosphate dehydrogenase PdxA [Blastocatellia bacterium]|nr:4-hydroxythreonine-4-phosphate dehydrogenase PdxA [Blastocatellia bacterium]